MCRCSVLDRQVTNNYEQAQPLTRVLLGTSYAVNEHFAHLVGQCAGILSYEGVPCMVKRNNQVQEDRYDLQDTPRAIHLHGARISCQYMDTNAQFSCGLH